MKMTLTWVVSNTQKSLEKGSGWITDSVLEHNINISKYNPLAGSNYIKLLKELFIQEKGWLMLKIFMIMNALNGVYTDT